MRSSRFGWSLVDRCDVELFTLRGIDRDYSAANSVWSLTSGFDGGSWCIEGRDRSVHVSLCVCDGCVSSAGASVLVQLLAWVECEYERCGFGVVRTVDSVISVHPNRVDGEICVLLCGSVESDEEWWSVERWREHLWSCRSIEGVGKSELFVGKNDVIIMIYHITPSYSYKGSNIWIPSRMCIVRIVSMEGYVFLHRRYWISRGIDRNRMVGSFFFLE